jgi:hypothetical protein
LAGVGIVLAPGSTTYTIPNDPMFSGLDLAFQALIRNPASPTGAAWSDLVIVHVD